MLAKAVPETFGTGDSGVTLVTAHLLLCTLQEATLENSLEAAVSAECCISVCQQGSVSIISYAAIPTATLAAHSFPWPIQGVGKNI